MRNIINDLKNYNNITSIDYGENVVFIKIGAEWCIPCIELEKVLVTIPNSIIYNISIDNINFESFFIDNKIYAVPHTFVLYKNVKEQFAGVRTEKQISEIIEKLKDEFIVKK